MTATAFSTWNSTPQHITSGDTRISASFTIEQIGVSLKRGYQVEFDEGMPL